MSKRNLWITVAVMLLAVLALLAIFIIPALLSKPLGPPMETQVPMPPAASTATQAVQESPEPSATPTRVCGRTSPMNILVLLIREKGQEPPQGALAMRLVHVDFQHEDGGMIAFTRDLVLPLMGAEQEQERLGEIFRQGQAMPEGSPTRGASLVANTIWSAFDITIDHYVVVDLDQLAVLIDDVGGVDVEIQQPYDASGIGLPHFQPGTMHMGGDMALAYATAADTGSIWDGLRRQTEVLMALRDEILSAGMIARIPELFTEYRELVVTDLSLQDLIDLGCILERVSPEEIRFQVVGPEETESGPDGTLLPKMGVIKDLIQVTFEN